MLSLFERSPNIGWETGSYTDVGELEESDNRLVLPNTLASEIPSLGPDRKGLCHWGGTTSVHSRSQTTRLRSGKDEGS